MLHPIFHYLVLIKYFENRFADGRFTAANFIFIFLGWVFRICSSWAYDYFIHCFPVTALIQTLLELELGQWHFCSYAFLITYLYLKFSFGFTSVRSRISLLLYFLYCNFIQYSTVYSTHGLSILFQSLVDYL